MYYLIEVINRKNFLLLIPYKAYKCFYIDIVYFKSILVLRVSNYNLINNNTFDGN